MRKRILLLSAGGHASVVAETIRALRDEENMPVYEKKDYLDDNSDKAIGKISELEIIAKDYDEVFCCIGNNRIRGELLEKVMTLGLTVPILIHPSAYISPSAKIKAGTIVEPKAVVNANSVIEEGCIISVGAIIDHDVRVEQYSHVNAGAICKAGSHIDKERKL